MIVVDSLHYTHRVAGSRKWCHLISDHSLGELHCFAEIIGLKKEWFQNKRYPHYDLVESKRKLAIKFGAKVSNSHREFLDHASKLKK